MFDDLFMFGMITVDVFWFDNDLFRDGGAYEWTQCLCYPASVQYGVILACQAVDPGIVLWDQDNRQSHEVSEQQILKRPGGNPSVNQLS